MKIKAAICGGKTDLAPWPGLPGIISKAVWVIGLPNAHIFIYSRRIVFTYTYWIMFAKLYVCILYIFTSEVKIDVRGNFSELILSLDFITSTILGGHIRDVECQSGNNEKKNQKRIMVRDESLCEESG